MTNRGRLNEINESEGTMPETIHSLLPSHCAGCGVDWPKGYNGICRSCGAGLPCRADTTDEVAPDPPCQGMRFRDAR